MNRLNYKQLTALITDLEEKYDLFSLKQDDVYIWKLIRVSVMVYLTTKFNGITSVHGRTTTKEKSLSLFQFLQKGFLNHPFFINKNTSKVIFENPRKVKFNNEGIDPYTHFLLKDAKDYHVIEGVYKLKHMQSVYRPSSSTHSLILLQNFKKITSKKRSLSSENLKVLLKVEQCISKRFDFEVPIIRFASEQLNNFITGYYVYNLLFRNKKWSEIYLVCSYGKEHIIAAAKDNNIKVIEFQHGVMGPYHLGYHFPKVKEVPYFPDEVLLFGEFWGNTTKLPSNVKLTNYGYPYLNEQVNYYQQKIRHKDIKQVTVISQGTIGRSLSELVLEVAKELPDYHFQYKLHPGEFGRWKKEYPALVKLSKLKNVTIYENEKPLYEMLAESLYTIGVYSTALFEAVAFEANPILIKLSGYEYMDDFRKIYELPIYTKGEEVASYINERSINEKIYHANIKNLLWSGETKK
ncbi:hypothetical protein [Peribacillus asahii]|uniref:hypothetical protein n=1 Tax=Peribacillus asahii TaxID=228899 RepID=UPI00207ACEBC|nr:hypothetical protein [Peribacillus asahii]USK59572.1 hypothetical protein LIT37_20820 [Peribacillus asahii]